MNYDETKEPEKINKAKKLCYVTTIHATQRAFVLPIVRWLKQMTDWDITLLCNNNAEFRGMLPENVHFIPISMKRGISLGGVGAMFKMLKVFRKEKFDLVQYSTPNASLYASLASWLAGVPVRLYCQWGIVYVGFHGYKRKLFKCIEKLVCSLSTWVEPDSRGNLLFSREEGLYTEKKSSIVWNGSASGVDLEKFDYSQKAYWRKEIRDLLQIPQDGTVIGFVGRVTGDKGINELLAAFKKTLQERPDVYLILVGRAEKTESLNPELYAWAQQEERVRFCGYTKVVERYISAMDVYVLPSYREGFGTSVIEAEAMGVPVIVSDIPGPTDAMLPDETGLVVPVKNVDALVEAMIKLIDAPELRITLGKAAREFAAGYFEQKQLAEHIVADRKRLLGEK